MQLVCAFVLACAKSRFSHDVAHIGIQALHQGKTPIELFVYRNWLEAIETKDVSLSRQKTTNFIC